jgi:integrase/recombinase XerD
MNEKGKATLNICEQKLNYLNYSKTTISNYLLHIDKFIKCQSKSCTHLNSSDFQNYIDNFNYSSISQQNQIISSLKFLYEKVLDKKYDKVKFSRPRKEKKLPKVINHDDIITKINNIENLKHKAALSLCYSVGLRVSEISNLKIEDIDSKRMIINIKNAKGRKDRIVPLSENILKLLREYYKEFKPTTFLFNGTNINKCVPNEPVKYSVSSLQKIYKKYIDENSSIHNLRHSCFTNLCEKDVNLKTIQHIAGHSSSKTTEIYLHISNNILKNVNLPI